MSSFPKRLKARSRRDTQVEFVNSQFRDLKYRMSSLFLRVQFLASKTNDHVFVSDEQKVKVLEKFTHIEALVSIVKLLCEEYSLDYSQFNLLHIRRYAGAFCFIRGFIAEHDILDAFSIGREPSTSIRVFPRPIVRPSQKVSISDEGSQEGERYHFESSGCEGRCRSHGPSARRNEEESEVSRGKGKHKATSAYTPFLNKTPSSLQGGFVNTKSLQRKSVNREHLPEQTEMTVSAKRDYFFSGACAKCDEENHSWFYCRKVSVAQRRRLAKELKVCFVCLKLGHLSKSCPLEYSCVKCSGRHNVRLCKKPVTTSPAATTSKGCKRPVTITPSSAMFERRDIHDYYSPFDSVVSPSTDSDSLLQPVSSNLDEVGTSTDKGGELHLDQ